MINVQKTLRILPLFVSAGLMAALAACGDLKKSSRAVTIMNEQEVIDMSLKREMPDYDRKNHENMKLAARIEGASALVQIEKPEFGIGPKMASVAVTILLASPKGEELTLNAQSTFDLKKPMTLANDKSSSSSYRIGARCLQPECSRLMVFVFERDLDVMVKGKDQSGKVVERAMVRKAAMIFRRNSNLNNDSSDTTSQGVSKPDEAQAAAGENMVLHWMAPKAGVDFYAGTKATASQAEAARLKKQGLAPLAESPTPAPEEPTPAPESPTPASVKLNPIQEQMAEQKIIRDLQRQNKQTEEMFGSTR